MRGGPAVYPEPAVRAAEWRAPPPGLALPTGAVHVWWADLDSEAARLRRLERSLSADELARAGRFCFARDRERFVVARGLLREITALYLDTAARRLRFGHDAHGKPFLVRAEHSALRFNVSHSPGTMLVALAREREVGVDIEHTSAGFAAEEIAEMVFSAPEKHALACLEGEAKRVAFLRFWTRKEAYVKADGRGMSLPLEHLDVSAPAGRAAVLDGATGRWRACPCRRLQTLATGPDYVASLAASGRDWHLACWQYQG